MANYSPFVDFRVHHSFFNDKKCHSLRFHPDKKTHRFMDNAEIIFKTHSFGFELFATDRTIEVFEFYCKDYESDFNQASQTKDATKACLKVDSEYALVFRVYKNNNHFQNITQSQLKSGQNLLYFNSWNGIAQSDGQIRLHHKEFVENEDHYELSDERLKFIVSKYDYANTPIMLVVFGLKDILQLKKKNSLRASNYYISLNTVSLYWKYLLFGCGKYKKMSIVDLDSEIDFLFQGVEAVEGREASVYLSSKPIVLKDKANKRFQLKDETDQIKRVLMKRLPVASTMQLNRLAVNGEQVIVSEIFVNL